MPSFRVIKIIPISEDREAVLSCNDRGELVIAQQVTIPSIDRKPTKMFLKNALIINRKDLESFIEALREASDDVLRS